MTSHDCNLVLNPIFSTPAFDAKKGSRVHFSITSPQPETDPSYLTWYMYLYIWEWCTTRSAQISRHFDCMESIIPRPNAQWEVQHDILDLEGKEKKHNLIFSDYCAAENTRLSISYFAPPRNPAQYRHILHDYCRAYTLIEGYNYMKRKSEYSGKPLDYITIANVYSMLCNASHTIASCTAEYSYNNVPYTMNCVTGLVSDDKEAQGSKGVTDYHRHYAIFALLSYGDETIKIPGSWNSLENYPNPETGFFASSFINTEDKRIVIAFRGTDGISDWIYSNKCFLTGCIPSQYLDAINFTRETIKKAGSNYSCTLVGHSLGGGLACLVSINTGLDAVTFDAPGVLKVAQKHFASNITKAGNITAYIIHGYDLVNMFGGHLVPLIQIIPSYDSKICTQFYEVGATLSQHNMTQIVGMFDEETGSLKTDVKFHTIFDTGINFGRYALQMLCTQWNRENFHKTAFEVLGDEASKMHYHSTIIYPNGTNIVIQRILLSNQNLSHSLDYTESQIVDTLTSELPFSVDAHNLNWSILSKGLFNVNILRVYVPYNANSLVNISDVFNDENHHFVLFDVEAIDVSITEQKVDIKTNTTSYVIDMPLNKDSSIPLSMQVGQHLEFFPHLSDLSGVINFSD